MAGLRRDYILIHLLQWGFLSVSELEGKRLGGGVQWWVNHKTVFDWRGHHSKCYDHGYQLYDFGINAFRPERSRQIAR